MNKQQLEERLIDFAVLIIEITEPMTDRKAAIHMSGQLVRSGTSPALNYGEAQSAESTNDFVHKLQVVLKELRESHICLRIIKKAKLTSHLSRLETALSECEELVRIFVKSVSTVRNNDKVKSKKKNE